MLTIIKKGQGKVVVLGREESILRLMRAMDRLGKSGNDAELDSQGKLNRRTVNRWRRLIAAGKRPPEPSRDNAEAADALAGRYELEFKRREQQASSGVGEESPPYVAPPRGREVRTLPIWTSVQCARHSYHASLVDRLDLASWSGDTYTCEVPASSTIHALRAEGDSMENELREGVREGAIVLFCPDLDSDLIPRQLYVICYRNANGDEQLVVKRYAGQMPGGAQAFTSDNPRRAGMLVTPEMEPKIWPVWRVINEYD